MRTPASVFDCQVKRVHEYKRRLLNVLHIADLYLRLREGTGGDPPAPRTFLLSGKAAPGYAFAKLIIRLIHHLAERINADPAMKGRLRVLFLPDYGVDMAEHMIPARDVSEQVGDQYVRLADLRSYLEAQERVSGCHRDRVLWARKAVLNVAASGQFSSDRTIGEYARDIWHAHPCPIVE